MRKIWKDFNPNAAGSDSWVHFSLFNYLVNILKSTFFKMSPTSWLCRLRQPKNFLENSFLKSGILESFKISNPDSVRIECWMCFFSFFVAKISRFQTLMLSRKFAELKVQVQMTSRLLPLILEINFGWVERIS